MGNLELFLKRLSITFIYFVQRDYRVMSALFFIIRYGLVTPNLDLCSSRLAQVFFSGFYFLKLAQANLRFEFLSIPIGGYNVEFFTFLGTRKNSNPESANYWSAAFGNLPSSFFGPPADVFHVMNEFVNGHSFALVADSK